ncbi:MAG: DsbA family oxidoreductase [Segetibacter sp.]
MGLQQTVQQQNGIVQNEQKKTECVEITFYTDPLCCWSWAFEPIWRKLQYQFRNQICFKYVMTGLLPSWKNYSDPLYSVNRPQQMGPVWMEVSESTGMPTQSKIWVEDPPASSYPACIAFKSMQLQSEAAAIKYLRMLRETVMLGGRNIAKQTILIEIAESLISKYPAILSLQRFASDLTDDAGLEAFRLDLQETQNRHITRTPTLIMRAHNKQAIMLTGYRPYPILLEALRQIFPEIEPAVKQISVTDYRDFWGTLTEREIDEIL